MFMKVFDHLIRAEKVVKKIEDPSAPAMRAPMYQVRHTFADLYF